MLIKRFIVFMIGSFRRNMLPKSKNAQLSTSILGQKQPEGLHKES